MTAWLKENDRAGRGVPLKILLVFALLRSRLSARLIVWTTMSLMVARALNLGSLNGSSLMGLVERGHLPDGASIV